jgi:hypothetical protein
MNLSGMFLPVSTGLKSARDPGPSTATVDSDAARVTEFNRGIQSGTCRMRIKFSLADTPASRGANPGLYAQDYTSYPRDEDTESFPQCPRPSQECACEDFGLGTNS